MAPSSIRCVILDLDGTLLDTEQLVMDVARDVAAAHGKVLTREACQRSAGLRPLEAWFAVADALGIEASAADLFAESETKLTKRWQDAAMLPGAARLMRHLHAKGVALGLATSTSRRTLHAKMARKQSINDMFRHTCCGDEVDRGKPAPDCFLEVARSMGVPPADCLVIEDAPSGVQAAVAAGMRVVVVPSVLETATFPCPDAHACVGCVEILPSLLEFAPEKYGLPPFEDSVAGTIPMDPIWRIRGTVVPGFGRGSKELGIPTANLDATSLKDALADAVTGIYAGWASVGSSPAVYKMCMSVGFNPMFKNKDKTCEPWILHEFSEPFYGQEIRLLVCSYIREEASFPSMQALIDRIHEDADISRAALEHPDFVKHSRDPFLTSPPAENGR